MGKSVPALHTSTRAVTVLMLRYSRTPAEFATLVGVAVHDVGIEDDLMKLSETMVAKSVSELRLYLCFDLASTLRSSPKGEEGREEGRKGGSVVGRGVCVL